MEQAAAAGVAAVLGGGARPPEGVLEDVLDAKGGCRGGVGAVAGRGGGGDAVGVGGAAPGGQGGVAVGEAGVGAVVGVVGIVGGGAVGIGVAPYSGDVVLDPNIPVDGPPLGGLDDGPGGGRRGCGGGIEGTTAAVAVGVGRTSVARGAIPGGRTVAGDGSLGLESSVERVGVAGAGGVVSPLVVVVRVAAASAWLAARVLPAEGRHVRGGGRTLLHGCRLGVRRVRRGGSRCSSSCTGSTDGLLGTSDVGLVVPRDGGSVGAQPLQLLGGQVGRVPVQVVELVVHVGGVVGRLPAVGGGGGVGAVGAAISAAVASSSAAGTRALLRLDLEGALLVAAGGGVGATAVRLGGLAALGAGDGVAGTATASEGTVGPALATSVAAVVVAGFDVRCVRLHLAGFAGLGRTDDVGRRCRGEGAAADQNGGGPGYLHGRVVVVVVVVVAKESNLVEQMGLTWACAAIPSFHFLWAAVRQLSSSMLCSSAGSSSNATRRSFARFGSWGAPRTSTTRRVNVPSAVQNRHKSGPFVGRQGKCMQRNRIRRTDGVVARRRGRLCSLLRQ